MVTSLRNETKQVIIQLEMIKKRVLKSASFDDLISEIDNSLTLTFETCEQSVGSQTELLAKFQYSVSHLKDIRAYLLELRPEHTLDFGHEINLSIGMIQFELWNEGKQKLYDLLDSVA